MPGQEDAPCGARAEGRVGGVVRGARLSWPCNAELATRTPCTAQRTGSRRALPEEGAAMVDPNSKHGQDCLGGREAWQGRGIAPSSGASPLAAKGLACATQTWCSWHLDYSRRPDSRRLSPALGTPSTPLQEQPLQCRLRVGVALRLATWVAPGRAGTLPCRRAAEAAVAWPCVAERCGGAVGSGAGALVVGRPNNASGACVGCPACCLLLPSSTAPPHSAAVAAAAATTRAEGRGGMALLKEWGGWARAGKGGAGPPQRPARPGP